MLIKPSAITTGFFQVEENGDAVNGSNAEVSIYRNGILTAIVPNISNVSTGVYKYEFETPSNWVNNDQIAVSLSIEVSGFQARLTKDLGTVFDLASTSDKINEIWQLLALDSTKPVVHTLDSITVTGAINIDLEIDQINNIVTNTRNDNL